MFGETQPDHYNHVIYRILHIEDLPSDAFLIRRVIRKVLPENEIRVVEDRADYVAELENFRPHIIIADYSLPGFNWRTAFEILKSVNDRIPFIVATGSTSEEIRNECLSEGVAAFVTKDDIAALGPVILDLAKDISE